MNNNYTDITVLLDKSGSMAGRSEDTIGGFNTFIDTQRKQEGTCKITLVQFATDYEKPYTAADVQHVAALNSQTYRANGGSTRLIDSAVRAIEETGQRLAAMNEKDRPGKVIFVVITDGVENDSRQFKKVDLNDRISKQEKEYNWQFIYLGANQDAIQEAGAYGFSAGKSLTYAFSGKGIQDSYAALSETVHMMRCCASGADMASVDFTEKARAIQNEELLKTQPHLANKTKPVA